MQATISKEKGKRERKERRGVWYGDVSERRDPTRV
jgi:hypothetical protein